MTKYWLGVVSKEHVQRGVQGGFAQVCHGKCAPLKRMKAGDWLIYYSPKISMEGNTACKQFTAIGQIKTGDVYQVEMFPGFKPFRIDVQYVSCTAVSITDLMQQLELTQNPHWGFMLRRGLVELSEADFVTISQNMVHKK